MKYGLGRCAVLHFHKILQNKRFSVGGTYNLLQKNYWKVSGRNSWCIKNSSNLIHKIELHFFIKNRLIRFVEAELRCEIFPKLWNTQCLGMEPILRNTLTKKGIFNPFSAKDELTRFGP